MLLGYVQLQLGIFILGVLYYKSLRKRKPFCLKKIVMMNIVSRQKINL